MAWEMVEASGFLICLCSELWLAMVDLIFDEFCKLGSSLVMYEVDLELRVMVGGHEMEDSPPENIRCSDEVSNGAIE
jgi:hypothetical protein